MGSFQTSDLARINRAIASGALVVRYGDGRQVTYRSLDELRGAKEMIERDLAGSAPAPARKVMSVSKGLEGVSDDRSTRVP